MKKLIQQLLAAIVTARTTTKIWHDQHLPGELREGYWKIYENHSPEMVEISKAIEAGQGFLNEHRTLEPTEPKHYKCAVCYREFVLSLVGEPDRVAPVDVLFCPVCGVKGAEL